MAVAGGTAPSLAVKLHGGTVVIWHSENRLIRVKTKDPETGKDRMVPTGTVELDIDRAIERLKDGESLYIQAKDLQELKTRSGWKSVTSIRFSGGS